MVLPSDFALPALPYLIALAGAVGIVGVILYRVRPPVTADTILAFAPWMAVGGGLYALYQLDAVPLGVAPLVSAPAVYVTVGVIAGGIWAGAADRPPAGWTRWTTPLILGGLGVITLLGVLVVALTATREPRVVLSVAILIIAVVCTGIVWLGIQRYWPVAATGRAGIVTVFAHGLDGVSTAVGYDILGFGEQTPLSGLVLQAGEALPVADVIGAGWLFVVVKLALAAFVVVVFEDFVREDPTEGYLLLGLVVAVGLGPGTHNVILFAVA